MMVLVAFAAGLFTALILGMSCNTDKEGPVQALICRGLGDVFRIALMTLLLAVFPLALHVIGLTRPRRRLVVAFAADVALCLLVFGALFAIDARLMPGQVPV